MSEVSQAQGAEVSHEHVRDPLVAFRFGIPAVPTGYVERPRLLSTMERGAEQPLTLVSSGAGTGKTSLVADWASRRDPEHTAWITFEPGDAHPSTFWSSLLAQLHAHGVAAAATPPAPGTAHLPRPQLAEIASTLSTRADTLVLVLDGWELTTQAVAKGLDFLLRHSGHRLGVVIVTRSDPVLPLNRYRLGNLMTEVRTADLAFTRDEVRALVESTDLTLTEESVDALFARTRGWVAGVRFATLSLRRQPDPDAAVLQLAGDTGNIAEYLMSEVLETRSEAERELLLATCVVEVLRPGLIEELAGPTAPRALAQLAHANAFVETVADQPGWYRYHPLFRELLRAELSYLAPTRSIALHRRAGRWHADHDMLDAAVSHAASAYQWGEAAQYVVDDLAVAALFQSHARESLRNTLRAMPDTVPGAAAAIVRAALAVSIGDTTAARQELHNAQDAGDPGRAQLLANRLISALVSLHDPNAAHALETAIAAERELQGQSPERLAVHPELVAMLVAARATALVRTGKVQAGREAFVAALGMAEAPGCESVLIYCLSHLALLDAIDGVLRRGSERAQRALDLVRSAGVDPWVLQDASLVAQSWIALQHGDAKSARERIGAVRGGGGPDAVLPAALLDLASARLARVEGDVVRATQLVHAVRQQTATAAPWVADLAAEEEVLSAISTGDAVLAQDLANALSGRDDTGALLSAARLRLRDRVAGAAESVAPIATRPSEPLVAQVTAALLVAEAELQRGQQELARASVQRATRLAAPEKLRLPFQEAAPAVRQLIARTRQPVAGSRVSTARDGTSKGPGATLPTPRAQSGAGTDEAAPMVDSLTAKELEVLTHLSQLLTTEEIAAEMFVSVNTVRTHVRSILRKLSVSRRHQAVRRARVLDIIDNP